MLGVRTSRSRAGEVKRTSPESANMDEPDVLALPPDVLELSREGARACIRLARRKDRFGDAVTPDEASIRGDLQDEIEVQIDQLLEARSESSLEALASEIELGAVGEARTAYLLFAERLRERARL